MDAVEFIWPGCASDTFTGLAAPSRGARETCVWRVSHLHLGPTHTHSLNHEEIIVALAGGYAVASVAEDEYAIGPGDAMMVPANTAFSLANPHSEAFEAMAALPVGATARVAAGQCSPRHGRSDARAASAESRGLHGRAQCRSQDC